MIARFLDGPAAGVSLLLRRAPHYLRAVQPGGPSRVSISHTRFAISGLIL
jgi:hypothetical protein